MNWKIRVIRWLLKQLRHEDDFRLRLGHSLILANPEPELYLEVVYGNEEESVLTLTFELETWERIRNTMQEMSWRVEQEYEPMEEGR